jgi:hypothetical protein
MYSQLSKGIAPGFQALGFPNPGEFTGVEPASPRLIEVPKKQTDNWLVVWNIFPYIGNNNPN